MTTASRPSICFLMPYFGKWPFWMPFFIESCRANPTIDWLFFTDCGQVENSPPNVRFVEMTYKAYCDRVSEKLSADFHPQNPYKLCDIRPAFGYIHEQELGDYDFWAFGDIDLVYGDLRAYFTDERLAGRDLLSAHARRVSGHCCLIRNTQEMRNLFFQMEDWKERMVDERHHALDERAFSRLFIRYKNWPPSIGRLLLWLSNPLFRRAEFIEAYSTPHGKIVWHDGSRHYPERWFWKAGVLTNNRDGARSYPYFHFMIWKNKEWQSLQHDAAAGYASLASSGAWQISPSGFEPIGASERTGSTN